jgi:hypothetical protein
MGTVRRADAAAITGNTHSRYSKTASTIISSWFAGTGLVGWPNRGPGLAERGVAVRDGEWEFEAQDRP